MSRVILKAFVLTTFTVASVFSSVSHAQQSTVVAQFGERVQKHARIKGEIRTYCVHASASSGVTQSAPLPQSTTALTGEWVGNIDPPGRSEFVRLSLTENAGEMLRPLKAKLTLVQLEGSRVRLELSSLKLVMTGTIAGDVIEGEAEVPGTKARFHLVRTVKVAPEILARYVGAYRFRNGDYLVIDSFPDTPDTLWVTDVKSGEARAVFPRSETQFTGGPALRVVSPTRQTLTFRGAGSSRNRFGSEGSPVRSIRDASSRRSGRSHFQKR